MNAFSSDIPTSDTNRVWCRKATSCARRFDRKRPAIGNRLLGNKIDTIVKSARRRLLCKILERQVKRCDVADGMTLFCATITHSDSRLRKPSGFPSAWALSRASCDMKWTGWKPDGEGQLCFLLLPALSKDVAHKTRYARPLGRDDELGRVRSDRGYICAATICQFQVSGLPWHRVAPRVVSEPLRIVADRSSSVQRCIGEFAFDGPFGVPPSLRNKLRRGASRDKAPDRAI